MNPPHGQPNHTCQTWNWIIKECERTVRRERTVDFILGLAVGLGTGWLFAMVTILGAL